MACQNYSTDFIRKAAEIVVETVTHYANLGHSRPGAIEQAALALEMSPRRAKSLWYDPNIVAVRRAEYEHLRVRYAAHLEVKADELAQRSREARERARVMRQQQELGVG
jgi:hypothetical protein